MKTEFLVWAKKLEVYSTLGFYYKYTCDNVMRTWPYQDSEVACIFQTNQKLFFVVVFSWTPPWWNKRRKEKQTPGFSVVDPHAVDFWRILGGINGLENVWSSWSLHRVWTKKQWTNTYMWVMCFWFMQVLIERSHQSHLTWRQHNSFLLAWAFVGSSTLTSGPGAHGLFPCTGDEVQHGTLFWNILFTSNKRKQQPHLVQPFHIRYVGISNSKRKHEF